MADSKKPKIEFEIEMDDFFYPETSAMVFNEEDMLVGLGINLERFPDNKRVYTVEAAYIQEGLFSFQYIVWFEAVMDPAYEEDDDVLNYLFKWLKEQMTLCFNAHLKKHNIELPGEFEFPDDEEAIFLEHAKKEIAMGREFELANPGFQELALRTTPSYKIEVYTKVIFAVMNETLIGCPHADHLHNRELLRTKMQLPFGKYLSLWNHASYANVRTTDFSLMQAMHLLLLADCVAQIMVSPMFDAMREKLRAINIQEEHLKHYLKYASDIRANFKDVDIDLLKQHHDWASLLRYH
jgi:hypothetical protein